MRTVVCSGLGRDVSALGFACAPLGSRVSVAQSRRALDYAFERNVTWYDVAPPDGDGEAEKILGNFLIGRRDRVVVCAKVGIARPSLSPMMHFFGAVKRSALNAFPELAAFSLGRAKLTKAREPMRAELIEPSVVESLRRLQTDYIDVLALHDPSPEDCVNPAILAALQHVVDKGYARCLAIAGSPDAIEAASAHAVFSVIQFCNNPFDRTVERIRSMRVGDVATFLALQNVFGGGAYERLSHLLIGDGGRLASLASQLAYGPPFMASEILLDYAFGNNPSGVVVASMSQLAHIDLNCARASRPPRTDVVEFVNKTVLASPTRSPRHG